MKSPVCLCVCLLLWCDVCDAVMTQHSDCIPVQCQCVEFWAPHVFDFSHSVKFTPSVFCENSSKRKFNRVQGRLAPTSTWCTWRRRRRRGTRESRAAWWRWWSSGWPGRAFWAPGSWTWRWSVSGERRIWAPDLRPVKTRTFTGLHWPSWCKTAAAAWESAPQAGEEWTKRPTWRGKEYRHNLEQPMIDMMLSVAGCVPGQRLSVDQFQDIPGNVENWLPVPLQDSLRKQPARERVTAIKK